MMNQRPPIPKYFQLAQKLSEQINNGRYQPHDQLPTEETLCQTYQVSRGTVRQALRYLQEQDLIYRQHGKGTFVTPPAPPATTLFSLASFTDEMQRQQRQPSTQLLLAEKTPAPPAVAAQLKVDSDTPLIHIIRLQLADSIPIIYEERYLTYTLCPQLLDEDLENNSIHWLIRHKHKIPLVRMTHTVEIGQLNAEQAQQLQTQPQHPAFFIERLTFTLNQQGEKTPAVWYHAICNEQQYRINATLQQTLHL